MYTGHFGIALAGKRAGPHIPLWVLIAASVAPDLVISLSVLAGINEDIMGSLVSSIPGGMTLALLVSLVYYFVARYGYGAVLTGVMVLSHTLADLVTGRLLAWPGGPEIGLYLYRFEGVDFILEASLVTAGWLLYRHSLPKPKRNAPAAWMILLVLLALQFYFFIRSVFEEPILG